MGDSKEESIMKKMFLLLLFLGVASAAYAQVAVPVTNYSFEEPDTATFTVAESPPDYGADIVTGYSFSGWNITDNSSKYVGLIDNAYIPAEISTPYGSQMAYCDNSAQFTSEVITTTQENTTYTLTVAFGNRDNDNRSAGNYTIEILLDGSPVASAFLDGQTIPRADWQDLSVAFGGRVAEEIVFGRISTGASNDIKQATELAQNMIRNWGMSEKLAPLSFGQGEEQIFLGREIQQHRDYSEETAREIDKEISQLITDSYKRAKKILEENMDILHSLADLLLEKETVMGKELDDLICSMRPDEELPFCKNKDQVNSRQPSADDNE